jgi:hypothetical protein
MVIPLDLIGVIGRREIWKSLNTGSRWEAKRLCFRWEAWIAEMFIKVRKGSNMDIQELVRQYIEAELDAGEQERLTWNGSEAEAEAIQSALAAEAAQAQAALVYNQLERIQTTVDQILSQNHIARESIDYPRLAREILKARVGVLKTEIQRWEGDYGEAYPVADKDKNRNSPRPLDRLPLSSSNRSVPLREL